MTRQRWVCGVFLTIKNTPHIRYEEHFYLGLVAGDRARRGYDGKDNIVSIASRRKSVGDVCAESDGVLFGSARFVARFVVSSNVSTDTRGGLTVLGDVGGGSARTCGDGDPATASFIGTKAPSIGG